MKIVIAGAGRGGLGLAVRLQELGHVVTIVDANAHVVQRAMDEHGLIALTGDATDVSILRQTEPSRADVVLGMLHRDADNVAVALLARAAGAKRVMVRMRDPEYRAIYEGAGVHQILSETEVLIGALATAIEVEAVRHSMVLGNGAAIAVEISIPEDATVVGRAVSDIASDAGFPSTCVIAGMSQDGKVRAPRGASVLESGMELLIVAAKNDLRAAVDFFLHAKAPKR